MLDLFRTIVVVEATIVGVKGITKREEQFLDRRNILMQFEIERRIQLLHLLVV